MAPSMLCHRHAIPCIWSYSARPAFQIASNTPAFSHSRNRLWIALALPKRSLGRAFHWQPVRSTKMMASNTCRAGLAGRPAPGLRTNALSGARTRGGINGSALCQKSSVTTQESTRFLVATALPCAAQSAAQDASILFTDKFLVIIKVPFYDELLCPTNSTPWIVPAGAQGFFFAMSLLSVGDIGNPSASRATSRFPLPIADCHFHWGNRTFNN